MLDADALDTVSGKVPGLPEIVTVPSAASSNFECSGFA